MQFEIQSHACHYNISKEILQPHNTCLTRFIISVFTVVYQGKWHKVLYSPGCRPLTRLGGTLTSFTGLPGNEVEESVSLWPAGRHSPLVSQTKFNRQSQDMKGDCCSQTDVTNAGGQANNRTCLWKYQNITCHGVFWLLSKRGTCIVFCSQPFFFLHPFTFFLSFPWYPWAKQAIHITFIWYNVHNTQTDACWAGQWIWYNGLRWQQMFHVTSAFFFVEVFCSLSHQEIHTDNYVKWEMKRLQTDDIYSRLCYTAKGKFKYLQFSIE